MIMKKIFVFAVLALLLALPAQAQKMQDLVKYVNTLQGTDSHWGYSNGNTYPSTAMPYPQHSWSAQTGRNGNGWKYQYGAKKIRGFQQVHQCSPWMGDYGVFSFMPVLGKLEVNENKRESAFSHDNEIAKPHYYKVTFDNGVTTEIAPTERAAQIRFSYPDSGDAYLVIDGYTRESSFDIDAKNRRITGWVNNGAHLNKRETFFNHFVMEFDQPFEDFGMWETEKDKEDRVYQGKSSGEGLGKENERGHGTYVKFKKGTAVTVKVASSYISPEQAAVTLKAEVGKDKTFEKTKQRGFDTWNALLNRVLVEGGTEEQMRTFYSCLFRANLFSHKFYEIKENGEPHYYSPYDGKIHDGYMFTDNGFWDTFRSQFPLTNILHPTMQGRYMNAILDVYDQCGWLPQWSAPGETGGMLGNHAISLLADAWAKGIRTFDPERALQAYQHEAMNKGPWGGANGRGGWQSYWLRGYVAYDDRNHGSSSQTLEYAYDDWCAYNIAKQTGNKLYEDIFKMSMYKYKNIFNPKTGFMGVKDAEGNWIDEYDPYIWGGPFTEGNAWHYTWSVFHDPQGLIDLYGSDEKFLEKLDSLFTTDNRIDKGYYGGIIHEMEEMKQADMGQYAHGNQPVQHVAYLYSYAGQPWMTQYRVRQVMDRLYNSTEQGYPGDEDQGGLSSWYVLSALGIYAVCPGTDQYVIGSPIFPKATITMENGNKFVIEAKNNSSDNCYIQSGTLNGESLDKNYITYPDIVNGGIMSFDMGGQPNTQRNTGKDAAPYSVSVNNEK